MDSRRLFTSGYLKGAPVSCETKSKIYNDGGVCRPKTVKKAESRKATEGISERIIEIVEKLLSIFVKKLA